MSRYQDCLDVVWVDPGAQGATLVVSVTVAEALRGTGSA